jgi:uncharacterized membrane protein
MSEKSQVLVQFPPQTPAPAQVDAAARPAETTASRRLASIDMLRGIAMLLMALDHWSSFARVDVVAEGYRGIPPQLGTLAQTIVGLLTNLSSGIFFMLTGTSIAFFERSRRKRGWTEWEITRFLLIRAALLLVLDQIVNRVGWAVTDLPLFEVLSAIAFTVIVLSMARLLPLRMIILIAAALFLIYPALVTLFPHDPQRPLANLTTILLQHNRDVHPMVENPLLARVSIVMGGYVMGRLLAEGKIKISASWLWVVLGMFVTWLVLRLWLLQGYGDFVPYNAGSSWLYLFIDSKQPPSFTFLLFNGAWALALLVGLQMLSGRLIGTPIAWMLTVLGQTSLFFFVAHMLFYRLVYRVLEALTGSYVMIPAAWLGNSDIARLFVETAVTLVILIPICAVYRSLRQKYSILSYL